MVSQPDGNSKVEKPTMEKTLIDCLFVLEFRDNAWVFRNAGSTLGNFLGQELADQDFLNFWTGHDRIMASTLLTATHDGRRPGILRARAETLVGRRIDLELTFAPLMPQTGKSSYPRLLGLYQTLEDARILNGRPVWRHRITEILPPDTSTGTPQIRLVASND